MVPNVHTDVHPASVDLSLERPFKFYISKCETGLWEISVYINRTRVWIQNRKKRITGKFCTSLEQKLWQIHVLCINIFTTSVCVLSCYTSLLNACFLFCGWEGGGVVMIIHSNFGPCRHLLMPFCSQVIIHLNFLQTFLILYYN